jgi:hypothetical protein
MKIKVAMEYWRRKGVRCTEQGRRIKDKGKRKHPIEGWSSPAPSLLFLSPFTFFLSP